MPEDCAICLESLALPGWGCQTLECGHIFHESCITEMRRKGASGSCPLCRATTSGLATVTEMLDSAVVAEMRGDHAGAVRLYHEILDLDIENVDASKAMNNLGVMYLRDNGVEQNTEKAVELFEQTHAAGNANATFNLGVMYDEGDGVEQNKAKAVDLYEQAHAAGNASATS